MKDTPGTTSRRLLLQGLTVGLFCVSLWFFRDTSLEQKALHEAINTLRQEKIHYDRTRKELAGYLSMREKTLACLEHRTPLAWEQIEIQLGEIGFAELYNHLHFLDRDIREQYGKNTMFVMERMEMKPAGTTATSSATGGFLIRGYLLSLCGGGNR